MISGIRIFRILNSSFTILKSNLAKYFERLWPINRSLTGEGNRETLSVLSEICPIAIKEAESGSLCFDWIVPPEYSVKEGWIKNSKGDIIIDFRLNNLHLMGYSEPIDNILTYQDLIPHLFYIPEMPSAIPYKTSYYKRDWGFCLSYDQFIGLDKNETYHVKIDSEFNEKGSMSYGEALLSGKEKSEVLFSTYICHPSMANNELSGPLVTSHIQKALMERQKLRYSYRFIYIPETIGSIYYLSLLGQHLKQNLIAGYVVTCVGDSGDFTFKKSRRGNTLADRAALLILNQKNKPFKLFDFFPTGSDERQYCSPGFNLPVSSLMRTMYAHYPEYHTSLDNKQIISFEAMEEIIMTYIDIIDVIESNDFYVSNYPFGEPFLGSKGIYSSVGGPKSVPADTSAILWILNLSDGEHDLIEISEKSSIPFRIIAATAKLLEQKQLINKKL